MSAPKSKQTIEAENEVKKILQKNLIKMRTDRQITQQQIAESLGISRQAYCNYETRSMPPHFLLLRLSRIYAVSPAVFYQRELNTQLVFQQSDSSIYGESSFLDLADSEKLLLMKYRQLNKKDKQEVLELVADKLQEIEKSFPYDEK